MRIALAVAVFLGSSTLLPAQSAERSLTREVLDRARTSLFDLQYAAADSIAREVLTLGVLSRPSRIEALQLIAAANYPDEPQHRRDAQARSALSQLARIDFTLMVPRELASRGLDSLYREILSTTFGVLVLVRRENSIAGVEGTSALRVRSTKPASFILHARTRDGIEAVLLDSVTISQDTTLQLRVGRLGKTILKGGEYDFVVTATEAVTKETVTRTFDGVAIVPAYDLVAIRPGVDSSLLRPVRAAPEKTAGIVGGIVLAAGTIVLGNGLRSSGPIGSGNYADNRHIGIGLVMGIAAGAAAWYDRGRTLDKNVAANRTAITGQSAAQRQAQEENARRAAEYRASITLNPDWR